MHDNEVARILEAKFKLGDFPMVRRRLFSRLERICQQRGREALEIVSQVVVESQSPNVRNAGQFFCYVVTRRLKEANLWDPAPDGNAHNRQVVETVRAEALKPVVDEVEKARDFIDVIRARAARERLEATKARLRERAASEGVEP